MDASDYRLDADRISEVFLDCLFAEGEPTDEVIKGEGVRIDVGFYPERLESHRIEINQMLDELPEQFHAASGGGWSFLNMCLDRHDNQWTGLHMIMEQLVLLGSAIGRVSSVLPKDMWSALPGSMPYYVIKEA